MGLRRQRVAAPKTCATTASVAAPRKVRLYRKDFLLHPPQSTPIPIPCQKTGAEPAPTLGLQDQCHESGMLDGLVNNVKGSCIISAR